MKPAPFEYHRPTTRGDALGLLTTHGGDAKPLAGGQSLIPAMNFRLATPAILVDLNAIGDLAYIRADETGDVRMGAMTRHATVERSDVIRRAAPLVHEAMPFIAHAAIRTRGTIGGSLAHADPAAELPAVMLALDARIRVESRAGAREIPASEFFTGLFSTALESGELLTEILIPLTRDNARAGVAFQEFSRRRGDFALAGVAARVAIDGRGICTTARVALFGVGDRPMLAHAGARALEGEMPTVQAIRAAAEATAAEDIDPTSDIHASSRYRRHLAKVLTRRVLEQSFSRVERA